MLGEKPYQVRNLEMRGLKTREGLRRKTVEAFLKEQRGFNRYEETKYHYIVERLKDKRRIYLKRPTRRCGFDFEIYVQGFTNSEDTRYTFREIVNDLRNKLLEDPNRFQVLYKAVERIYGCEETDLVINDYANMTFRTGEKVETILKLLKWMFIEQDLQYWNHSGRNILKTWLDSIVSKKNAI